jgi:hypothetical protein
MSTHPATCTVITFDRERPRIAPDRDGGWLVIRRQHGWLFGSRQQALAEFAAQVRIEQTGSDRHRGKR